MALAVFSPENGFIFSVLTKLLTPNNSVNSSAESKHLDIQKRNKLKI